MSSIHYKSKNYLRFAGDVTIDRVVITTSAGAFKEIQGQVLQIQIFEDIFSPFITGVLSIKDTLDLTNVLPLIGEEYLDLKVVTPQLDAKIEGRFYIYKMADKVALGDRSAAYELYFVSAEAVVDMNKRNSKVYSGKISDIIPTFVKDKIEGLEVNDKRFLIEETRNSIKYISNFWSPIKNISYLADNAISQTQSPSYLFFENRDGFNFKSLELLYSGQVFQDFVFDRYTRDEFPGGGNVLNIDQDFKRIGTYDHPLPFDYMERLRSGMLASKLVSYDSTKKMYTVRNYSAGNRFSVQKHLNEFPLFSPNATYRSNARQFIYPRAFETFTSFGDTTNARIVQERISVLAMAEANKISLDVAGRLDYTVGKVVTLTMNKRQPITKRDTSDETLDKVNSGRYLISAINHVITTQGHTCQMELIKDSTIKKHN